MERFINLLNQKSDQLDKASLFIIVFPMEQTKLRHHN